ncbi:MAG: hypothetical protein J1F67_05025 [Muribaculaceae bacterium]|nr:hypothetical protein [Muribaculaceae bacterium]
METNKETKRLSNDARLKNLGIGESDSWPLISMDTIRASKYRVEKKFGKKFVTKTDAESITVTRVG